VSLLLMTLLMKTLLVPRPVLPPVGADLITLIAVCPLPAMAQSIDRAQRLGSLWVTYLLAMIFHVDLGLMPLFHGLSPEIESHVNPARLPLIFGAMLVYFLIPVAAILLTAYAASDPEHPDRWRPWRRIHFWISVVYTATNIPHLIADILVPDSRADQVALMVVLLLIGLLINVEGWQWWRETRRV
jgi:hypothetical protein